MGNKVPIRVLVGSADRVETVEKVRKETLDPFAAAGWDISLRVLEGVGHLLPVEAVDEVVREIEVLLELERS
jgi:pimeloyl-ACP methyl ester carboxylesterase